MLKIDFFVVGTQKAGTTTLHDLLSQHTDLSLPKSKETHFFSHEEREALGLDWYKAQLRASRSSLVGEIDPEYMFSPMAAEKIRATTTARKFIFVLRDPLDRARSQYLMTTRRGYETFPFGEALALEEARLSGETAAFARDHWSYASRSLYSPQILNWQRTFPDAEMLFLKSDSLTDRTATSGYLRVCDFIGTSPMPQLLDQMPRSNVASAPRSKVLRDFMYATRGKSKGRRALMSVIPSSVKVSLFKMLDRSNQGSIRAGRDVHPSELPEGLLERMVSDLEQCEVLTGLDLTDWSERLEGMAAAKNSGQFFERPPR